jgi:tRNA-specific 2-thiouridylase
VREIMVDDWHWIDPSEAATYTTPRDITVKIRYRQAPHPATLVQLTSIPESQAPKSLSPKSHISFSSPQRAVPPGQIAVAYDGERVIGSGIIQWGK